MDALLWIITSGLLMSVIALVGSLVLLFEEETLKRLKLPLVAFAAGSLIGGAFFHMLPEALVNSNEYNQVIVWVLVGFTLFFVLEQLMHWHHCRRASAPCRQPLTYLILIGDGLHNFIGGLAIGGTFLIDIRLGITAWLAAAAHEIPQELGDFSVLIHGGWSKGQALVFNVLSALTFLAGGLLAYTVSFTVDVGFLLPLAAGNFIYIGASDLIPEVNKHENFTVNVIHFLSFVTGVSLMGWIKVLF